MSSIYRFLTSDGAVGTTSNYDLAGAADIHWTGPPAGETWEIHRIIINVEDTGTVNTGTFGALTALTNGCKVDVVRGSTSVLDLLDGITIKNNGDWSHLCYDLTIGDNAAGTKQVTARWTFAKAGEPLKLVGNLDEKLQVQTQDDTTGLVHFTVMAQGRKV